MHPPPFPPLPSEVETLPGLDQGERIGRLVQEITRLRRERNEALMKLEAASTLLPPPRRLTGRAAAVVGVALMFLPALGAALAKRWPELAVPIDVVLETLKGLG